MKRNAMKPSKPNAPKDSTSPSTGASPALVQNEQKELDPRLQKFSDESAKAVVDNLNRQHHPVRTP